MFVLFCATADPQQNRLQSVIHTELSLTTGWPWHYSDGDCLTNKHFRFTSTGCSQCCCSGYTLCIEDTLNWKKERWPTLLKAPTGPENTLWLHYKNHIMVVNTITKLHFCLENLQRVWKWNSPLCRRFHTEECMFDFTITKQLNTLVSRSRSLINVTPDFKYIVSSTY